MLLPDFFDRLLDRAESRYGQSITPRQFRDWREEGLIPGPAAPQGRRRGQSPLRHWPSASYRQALWICRYKYLGAYRASQWRIMLWLSGETIDADRLRKAIKKEVSILRRSTRGKSSASATGRSKPTLPLPPQAEAVARDFGFTRSELHATSSLTLQQGDVKLAPILRAWAERTFGAEHDDDIIDHPKEDEISMIWHPGHLDISGEKAGWYVDGLRDTDFDLIRALFRKREVYNAIQVIAAVKIVPDITVFLNASLLSFLSLWLFRPEWRINSAIMMAFDVSVDLQNGADPHRRLAYLDRQTDSMRDSLRRFADMKSGDRSIDQR